MKDDSDRPFSQFWRADQPGGYFDLGKLGHLKLSYLRLTVVFLITAWENGDSFCNIDNDPNVPCDQGLVPTYVAKVQSVADVQSAVCFARDNNLAVRVKGASHDLLVKFSDSS
jgi:hypothetical protein